MWRSVSTAAATGVAHAGDANLTMIEKLRRSVSMISNGIDAEQHSEWENQVR